MSFNIRIGKDSVLFVIVFCAVIAGIGLITAYDSGQPSVHGHDANEVAGGGGASLPACSDTEILKYNSSISDWECANDSGSCTLGDWTTTGTLAAGGTETMVEGNIYIAQTDGFLLYRHSACCAHITIKTDSNPTPTTIVAEAGRPYADDNFITSPIKEGDYFMAERSGGSGTTTLRWVPLECSGGGGSSGGSSDGGVTTSVDSEGQTLVIAHAYKAQTAGFATAYTESSFQLLTAYLGETDDPAGAGIMMWTVQDQSWGNQGGTLFVPKDQYFEFTSSGGTPTIRWTPMVAGGGAPIDQD